MHVLNRIELAFRRAWGKFFVAKVPKHNDVYIVEFPKSGVTWLSTILANVALISSGRSELASYTAAHFYVPDIHITRNIGEMAYSIPPVRMIKSHSKYNPNYIFVIYLVRHPLDVMKSYYRFCQELRWIGVNDFDSFCRSKRFGIPAWKRHINSWLVGDTIAQRVHLCRFEDLVKDSINEINLISKNFGWNIEESVVKKAVLQSSMQKMKESESLYRSRNPRYNINFVGGEDIVGEVHKATLDYIEGECAYELKLLGYS